MVKNRTRWAAAAAVLATSGMVAAAVTAGAAPAAAETKAKPAFVIGFANSTQGAITFPGISDGAQAAVAYVNAHGGINGRPLVLAVCDLDTTPEKNAACGSQFANDSRLKMVNTGFSLAAGAFQTALAPSGLPILQSFPTTEAEYIAKNAVTYNGGAVSGTIGVAELANAAKARTITRFVPDNASAPAGIAYFAARYKGDVKTVLVPATVTDPLPYILQGDVLNKDMIALGLSNCNPWLKPLAAIGVPGNKIIGSTICLTKANITANPAAYDGWRAPYILLEEVLGRGLRKDLDLMLDEYPKYAKVPVSTGFLAFTSQGWGAILTLQNVLRGVPDSVLNDKKALYKVLHAYTGPSNLGGPAMKCGLVKTMPALCSMFTYKVQLRGGKFYQIAG